jgi:prophage antirepressor-like protein
MKNKLTVFNNADFGEIRTLEENGTVLFGGTDVAKALGYSNPYDAISRHCKGVVKREGVSRTTNQHGVTTEQTVEMSFIPEGDVYRLIVRSKLPTAEHFESWVFDEVLPSIRKTGEYKITPAQQNRLDIMERNSRAREASLWLRISAQVKSDTYRQVCASYASTVLAGREVIPLPQTTQHHYSATEIGEMFGISKQAIGNLANKYGMKTDEYGSWYHDKSPYSAKEVDVFKYNDHAVQRFRDLLG